MLTVENATIDDDGEVLTTVELRGSNERLSASPMSPHSKKKHKVEVHCVPCSCAMIGSKSNNLNSSISSDTNTNANGSFIFSDTSFDMFGLTFADQESDFHSSPSASSSNSNANSSFSSSSVNVNVNESPHYFTIIVYDEDREVCKKVSFRFPNHQVFEEAICEIRMGRSSRHTKLVPMSPRVTFTSPNTPLSPAPHSPLKLKRQLSSPSRSVSKVSTKCELCGAAFSLLSRSYHCNRCPKQICSNCSFTLFSPGDGQTRRLSSVKEERMCNRCGGEFSDECRVGGLFGGGGGDGMGWGLVSEECDRLGVDPRRGFAQNNPLFDIDRSLVLALLIYVFEFLRRLFWKLEHKVVEQMYKHRNKQAMKLSPNKVSQQQLNHRKLKEEGDKLQNFWKSVVKFNFKKKTRTQKRSSKAPEETSDVAVTPSHRAPPPTLAIGILKISCVEAIALPSTTLDNKSCPYCRVTITGYDIDERTQDLYEFAREHRFELRTDSVSGTLCPVFRGGVMTLPIVRTRGTVVRIEVLDSSDVLGGVERLLGGVEIDVKELGNYTGAQYSTEGEEFWITLQRKPNRLSSDPEVGRKWSSPDPAKGEIVSIEDEEGGEDNEIGADGNENDVKKTIEVVANSARDLVRFGKSTIKSPLKILRSGLNAVSNGTVILPNPDDFHSPQFISNIVGNKQATSEPKIHCRIRMSVSEMGDLLSHLSKPAIPATIMEKFEPRRTIFYADALKSQMDRWLKKIDDFMDAMKFKPIVGDEDSQLKRLRRFFSYHLFGVCIVAFGRKGILALHCYFLYKLLQNVISTSSKSSSKMIKKSLNLSKVPRNEVVGNKERTHDKRNDHEKIAEKNAELNSFINFIGKLVGNAGLDNLQNLLHDLVMVAGDLNDVIDGREATKTAGFAIFIICSALSHLYIDLRVVWSIYFSAFLFVLTPAFVRTIRVVSGVGMGLQVVVKRRRIRGKKGSVIRRVFMWGGVAIAVYLILFGTVERAGIPKQQVQHFERGGPIMKRVVPPMERMLPSMFEQPISPQPIQTTTHTFRSILLEKASLTLDKVVEYRARRREMRKIRAVRWNLAFDEGDDDDLEECLDE